MKLLLCAFLCGCILPTACAANIRYNVVPVDFGVVQGHECRIAGGFIETDGTLGRIDAPSHVIDYAIEFDGDGCRIGALHPLWDERRETERTVTGTFDATATTLSLPSDTDPEPSSVYGQNSEPDHAPFVTFHRNASHAGGTRRYWLTYSHDLRINREFHSTVVVEYEDVQLDIGDFMTIDSQSQFIIGFLGDCDSDGVVSKLDLPCHVDAVSLGFVQEQLEVLPGDFDGENGVDFSDFLVLSNNFGTAASNYGEGDVDLNERIDFDDFLLLAANYGNGVAMSASVPEPESSWVLLTLLAITGGGLGRPQHRPPQ